jgi:hypothetical protein
MLPMYCTVIPLYSLPFDPEDGGRMFLHDIRKSVPEYSVTSQNAAPVIMIFSVIFKFDVASTKSETGTEDNIC